MEKNGTNGTPAGRKPDSDKSGQRRGVASRFLRRKEWVAVGVLVALVSLFVVVFGLGASDPATQAASQQGERHSPERKRRYR